jgi:hypothetical protein
MWTALAAGTGLSYFFMAYVAMSITMVYYSIIWFSSMLICFSDCHLALFIGILQLSVVPEDEFLR